MSTYKVGQVYEIQGKRRRVLAVNPLETTTDLNTSAQKARTPKPKPKTAPPKPGAK